ncbi:MAG: HAMP domain-containing histidine kinase [Candidatus Harrisonbacteria bacterium]|nr:HAMP domain-containing histidine kinase [Candidatus Harrisonbacteria bacterium]
MFGFKKKITIDDIAALVHQMRAPLTAVRWVFENLKKNPTPEERDNLVKMGVKTSEHLSRLVDDVLNLAKMESGIFDYQLETMDLIGLLRTVIEDTEFIAKTYNVQLFLESPDGEQAVINGDARKLEIVFFNLIDNAIKYNRPGGRVSIKVQANEKRGEFLATVSDTGIGIPKNEIKKLFNKFYRVETPQSGKVKGSGLGLYLVKEIIKKHGGKVWVESELGKGTTFYLLFPMPK